MWEREISPEWVRAQPDNEECTTSRLGTRRNSGVDRQAGRREVSVTSNRYVNQFLGSTIMLP
jgi:hypothetical protein